MGFQFEQLTSVSPVSLTQVVADTAYLRCEGYARAPVASVDLEAWINAIQRQSPQLIQSKARQADLEAWLDAANLITGESTKAAADLAE